MACIDSSCVWFYDGFAWMKLLDCPAPCVCVDMSNAPPPLFFNFMVFSCGDGNEKKKSKPILRAVVEEVEFVKGRSVKRLKRKKPAKKTKAKKGKKKKK